MTPDQKRYKNNLIQKIQVNKHNVFMDDDDRKEFMLSRFGVDSTTKMNIDQLKLLLDFCLQAEFAPDGRACPRKVSDIPLLNKNPDKELITEPQKEMIRGLWKEKATNKAEEALLNFIFKITGYKIILLDDLLKGKATKVIQALINVKPPKPTS